MYMYVINSPEALFRYMEKKVSLWLLCGVIINQIPTFHVWKLNNNEESWYLVIIFCLTSF